MILYLDTSALVKLYVRETGSRIVAKLARESAALATSIVAYAETRAAFARLMRAGVTVEKRHHERLKQFNADWESFMRIELGHALARTAGELLRPTPCADSTPFTWRAHCGSMTPRAESCDLRPLTPSCGQRRNARACQWRHEEMVMKWGQTLMALG